MYCVGLVIILMKGHVHGAFQVDPRQIVISRPERTRFLAVMVLFKSILDC